MDDMGAEDEAPFPFSASGLGPPGPPLQRNQHQTYQSGMDVDGWRLESLSSAHNDPHSSASLGSSGGTGSWSGARPFSFARRTGRLDWETLLRVDLERVVRERDLSLLQRLLPGLVFSDIPQCDVAYLEAGGRGGGSGAANALHLFRLCQLEAEALLHVQAFLLRSLQAKEGAVAREREKHAFKLEEERLAARALKARLGAAQRELKQARAIIAGYERGLVSGLGSSRHAMPVYLPSHDPVGLGGHAALAAAAPPHAHYPGEVYVCVLCSNAFSAPHFLAAHYQRRHPGFVPERPYQPPQQQKQKQEEKEPAPYVPPPPPRAATVDAQALAALRAELTASLDAQWTARRAEDHRRLLSRLSALERALSAQFSAVSIPAEMAPAQRRLHRALLDEVEAIKAELARDARVGPDERDGRWGAAAAGEPHWNIVPAQQQQPQASPAPAPAPAPVVASEPASPVRAPASPVRMPPSVAPSPARTPVMSPHALDVDVTEPARPTPLALASPVDSNPAFSPSPMPSPPPVQPPVMDPSSLSHLPRLERLRQALLARSSGQASFAPFPELPWLHSRYAASDWDPPPATQLAAVAARVDLLTAGENAHLLAQLEAEMHALDGAADSYNTMHDAVESRAAARPLDEALLWADDALDRRQEFLPVWERLLLERERRDAARAAEATAAEAQQTAAVEAQRAAARAAQEAALERAIADQRERDAQALLQAQQTEAHERALQEQRRMHAQHEFARAHSVQTQQQHPAGLARAASSPVRNIASSPFVNTSTPSHSAQQDYTQTHQQPAGSTWAPYGSTNLGGGGVGVAEASPSPSPASRVGGGGNNYSGQNIMAGGAGQDQAAEAAASAAAAASSPLGDMVSPLSVVRPEGSGWGPSSSPLPQQQQQQQQQSIMPRTPSRSPSAGGKAPLSVFHPAAARAQLGPSPSASFSSTADGGGGGASFGFGSGASYGGASIMRSPGPGGLDHISEGDSVNESASVMAQLRVGGGGGSGGGGSFFGGGSRRDSVEQEGKYAESAPASPAAAAAAIAIPRTEVDEEFEAILSPKRVAPRTQPPLIIAAPASASHAAGGQSFMYASPAQSFNAAQSLHMRAPLASDRANTQPGSAFAFGHAAMTPGPGAATPGPGSAAAPTSASHLYSIGGHGFTFGQRGGGVNGGNGIAEGAETDAPQQSDEHEFRASSGVQQWQQEAAAEAGERAEEERRRAATERARREEEEEFGVPSSFGRPAAHSAVQQQAQASAVTAAGSGFARSRGRFDDSLQLDDTITLDDGRGAAQPTAHQQQYQQNQLPSQHPSMSRMLSPSNEQLRNEHAAHQAHPQHSHDFLRVDADSIARAHHSAAAPRTGELTPAVHAQSGHVQPMSMQPTPSPMSMLSQPGYAPGGHGGDPTSPAYANAFGAASAVPLPSGAAAAGDKFGSEPLVPQQQQQPQGNPAQLGASFGQMEVESFHASPSASFAVHESAVAPRPATVTLQPYASPARPAQSEQTAQQPMALASPAGGDNAVQSFYASPSASPLPQRRDGQGSEPYASASPLPRTFISNFGDEDEFPADDYDGGPSAPAAATAAVASAVPNPSARRSGVVGPLHSDDDDDEVAASSAGDSDNDDAALDAFGRPKPQGVAVIAPGSVSSARAKLVRETFQQQTQVQC